MWLFPPPLQSWFSNSCAPADPPPATRTAQGTLPTDCDLMTQYSLSLAAFTHTTNHNPLPSDASLKSGGGEDEHDDDGVLHQLSQGSIICDRFKLLVKKGEGSFGLVWSAIDIHTEMTVAIKFFVKASRTGARSLLEEFQLLRELRSVEAVPRAFSYYKAGKISNSRTDPRGLSCNEVMVEELLRCNVSDLCERLEGKVLEFESRLAIAMELGIQIFSALHQIHDLGILHNDISDSNIMLGQSTSKLYLIDFGLSSKWKRRGEYDFRKNKSAPLCFVGTPDFVSCAVMDGFKGARRDDAISVCYVMIWVITGTLPWEYCEEEEALELKKNTTHSELCDECPQAVQRCLDHVTQLGFFDEPDYPMLVKSLEDVAKKQAIKFEDVVRTHVFTRKKQLMVHLLFHSVHFVLPMTEAVAEPAPVGRGS